MLSTDLAYWLFWLLGILALTACLAVTWWGLYGDPGRWKRRCPRCWYDLSHSSGMKCPECGHTARNEKHLYRTRRRWLPALVSAFLAALGATWTIEQAQQRGWVSLLPTRAIVLALPFVGESHEPLNTELIRRMGGRRLSTGQWQMLMRRCIKGDHTARPVTEPWERKYGGLLDQGRSILPAEFELDRILLDLPARVELTSDRPWPRDAPVCLDLQVHHWWPPGTMCRIRLTPAWAGGEPITIMRSGARRRAADFPVVVSPAATSPLVFDMMLERRLPGDESHWQTVQQRPINVPVDFQVTTVDAAMEPIRDEALDEALQATFSFGVVKWLSGRSPVRVRYDPRPTYGLRPSTAIGAIIEILFDGKPARRLDIWWSLDPDPAGRDSGWDVVHEDVPLLLQADAQDGRWQLRVRGDAGIALRAGPAGAYWAGEFTMPLVIDERQRWAPARDWWREEE